MAGAVPAPEEWRTRAWYQIQRLASHLGQRDAEVQRRERMFTAIDRFSHQSHREHEFMKLELCTRMEAELLEPMLGAEHVRAHILPPEAEPAAPATPAASAHGSKPADAKATSAPTVSSPAGAAVVDPSEAWGAATHEPAAAPEASHAFQPEAPAPAPAVDPKFVFKPVGRKKRSKSKGPQKLYKDATAAWSTYQAHEMKGTIDARTKAKEAARIVRDIVMKLAKIPEGQNQYDALLSVVGLEEGAIVQGELEKRIR